ncbi:peptidase family M48-domain-containing protein [Epithele typhae]|uniref:peptidase family M48-domain-containing protein n=1 Tax=Epithele typhae TaxID=378194 RepID=UPI002008B5CC|nr:peptidase family M48-domain-containing protein [Epithele typhae]KAH9938786.1 peptidase family M48-domain-containing protein [Epithele typhae]
MLATRLRCVARPPSLSAAKAARSSTHGASSAPRALQAARVQVQARHASFRSGRNYVRFDGSSSSRNIPRWNDRRMQMVYGVTAAGVLYYVSHLEQVPESGRWRFMDVSLSTERKMAEEAHKMVRDEFHDKALPPNHPVTRHVRRVASQILEGSGLGQLDVAEPGEAGQTPRGAWSADGGALDEVPQDAEGTPKWRLYVVDAPGIPNAMVTYGFIVVFTGILPIAKDEHGLAAILGHEIAHTVARHMSESQSMYRVVLVFATLLDVIGIPLSSALANLILSLPHSRTQESEADTIGMRLCARACFDPEAVPRLGKLEESGSSFDFLRTHPSSLKRVAATQKMLPEAYDIQASSPRCGGLVDHIAAFKDRWRSEPEPSGGETEVVWT